MKGADMRGLAQLVQAHAGPNPPVAPLPAAAEEFKVQGNAAFKEEKWQEAIDAYSKAIDAAVSPQREDLTSIVSVRLFLMCALFLS